MTKKTPFFRTIVALSAFVVADAGPYALIALVSPTSAFAGRPAKHEVKTRHSAKEDTISSVSSTLITVVHTKYKIVKGKPQEITVKKTYDIAPITTIEVNGANATAGDLHAGMEVTISADAPTSLEESDSDNGGVARDIIAH